MKKVIPAALLALSISAPAFAVDGMINVQSKHSVQETADKMEGVLKEKGMTVFNRIKHSEGASKVGVELRDTELVLFGNPKVGSPLMACSQSIAIDLPQKALIWEDESQNVWISYNDPKYLEKKHNLVGCEAVIEKVGNALAGITKAVAS